MHHFISIFINLAKFHIWINIIFYFAIISCRTSMHRLDGRYAQNVNKNLSLNHSNSQEATQNPATAAPGQKCKRKTAFSCKGDRRLVGFATDIPDMPDIGREGFQHRRHCKTGNALVAMIRMGPQIPQLYVTRWDKRRPPPGRKTRSSKQESAIDCKDIENQEPLFFKYSQPVKQPPSQKPELETTFWVKRQPLWLP